MALATGVDIVELDRVRELVSRYRDRFLLRIYTPAEIARYGERTAELAVRFAAKEAVSKALGVGLRQISQQGIGWQEVEVLPDPLGKPLLNLTGRAQTLAEEQGLRQWAVSLSHSRYYAVAVVVATG